MKGLFRNNFYSMQEGIKLSALAMCLAGTPMLLIGNSAAINLLISIAVLVFPINIGASLQTDETSKWNKFEITLPVSRRTIIKCKYLSYLVLLLIGLICSAVIILFAQLLGHELVAQRTAFFLLYGTALALFIGAFLYPLILAFGAVKSELFIVVSTACAMVAIAGISTAVGLFIKGVNFNSSLSGSILSVVSLLCFSISYLISVRIHSKKEL